MKLVDYDTYKYDYKNYWNDRDYEDKAEELAIEGLLKNRRGDWFLDVGGSFGRNIPRYYDKYKNCIIIDYSLETLIKYQAVILKNYPKTILIAANAYKLPFRKEVFNGGLMVRVLHHIEKPAEYFKEIFRVLAGDSVYIQEFANKVHLKARIRALLRLDFSIFNLQPYQQPNQGYNEGTKGESTTFLNFHPQYIKNLISAEGFAFNKEIGASYLRLNFFKKLLSTKVLVTIERLLQKTISKLQLSPSVFFLTEKEVPKAEIIFNNLENILICPSCQGELVLSKEKALCKECKKTYLQKAGIWDFRTA